MMWPSPRSSMPGREAADQPQRRVVVQRHRPLDVVPAVQRLGQRPADRPAGVVDQDVDAAELLLDAWRPVRRRRPGRPGRRRWRTASPPAAVIRSTRSSSSSWRRATTTTVAPRRANFSAAASPMPDDAPVSRMRLPLEVDLVAVGPVQHQLRGDRRSHAGQHQLVGQPAQRALTHAWSLWTAKRMIQAASYGQYPYGHEGDLDAVRRRGEPLDGDTVRKALAAAEFYWLTTVRADGRPHITPLVGAWVDDSFVFCTGSDEQKARNLEKRRRRRRHHRDQHLERRTRCGCRRPRRTCHRVRRR